MKKGVLFILLMMTITTLKAQWSVTPEIGITSEKLAETENLSYYFPSTWKLGVGVEYDLNKRFSLKSGIYYTQGGGYSISYLTGSYDSPFYGGDYFYGGGYYPIGGGRMTVKKNSHFLQLPFMGKYAWSLREEVKINVAAGPYIAYSINDNRKWQRFPVIGISYPAGYRYVSDSKSGGIHSLDWGISGSVGMEVKNWVANLGCGFSLRDEAWWEGTRASYHPVNLSAGYKLNISLSAGYKFNLGK
ncbi:MAG: PorT family protein [Tannerellaceae bacterium]|jgi:hypothetical protein|nr:PorT family protein [Tannerellaceae bacterium]